MAAARGVIVRKDDAGAAVKQVEEARPGEREGARREASKGSGDEDLYTHQPIYPGTSTYVKYETCAGFRNGRASQRRRRQPCYSRRDFRIVSASRSRSWSIVA